MTTMNPEYIEKIYAGWLAKVIGVRLGVPIEGWTYARLAAAVAGWELPEPWREILSRKHTGCHFEYPGSTFGLRIRAISPEQAAALGSLCGNSQNSAPSGISTCGDCQSQTPAATTGTTTPPPSISVRNAPAPIW